MFQYKLKIGAVDAVCIVAVGTVNVVRAFEFLAKIGAYEFFVAQFCPESRASQAPVEVSIEIHAIYIGAVVVVRILLRRTTEKFKSVHTTIPIDGRTNVKLALFVFSLQSCERFKRMFKLVVVLGCIERIGTKVFYAHTSVPPNCNLAVVVVALIESFACFVVGIQPVCLVPQIAVATCKRPRELVVPTPLRNVCTCARCQIAIRATFYACRERGRGGSFGYNIYRT